MKQHEIALLKANAIRLEQARIKRETTSLDTVPSRLRLAELLLDPSDAVCRMSLLYFLRCAHRVGPNRAKVILDCAAVSEHRLSARVGVLTPRERRALALELQRIADREPVAA